MATTNLSAIPYKRVVLVAGFDYPPDNGGPLFENKCNNRLRILLNNEKKRANAGLPARKITATLFDIRNGRISTNDNGAMNGDGTFKWVELQRWEDHLHPLALHDYKNGRFPKERAGEFISITTVYKYLQAIGYHDPGSLIELSFFSHGYEGGPVLVNSYDDLGEAVEERDSGDNDPRPWKDFKPRNMSATEFGWLKSAFDNDGFSWVWGCNAVDVYENMLRQLTNSTTYRKGNPHDDTNRVQDSDTFTFTIRNRAQHEYFHDTDDTFFPDPAQAPMYPFAFQRTFAQFKEFVRRGIDFNGRKDLAVGINKRVYGAAPGTSAEYNGPLMSIPAGPPSRDDYRPHIKFYRSYMGARFDDEGRLYMAYDP